MTETVDTFDDPLLASVYDDLNPWDADSDFYLGLAREIGGAVLDLGCGTGLLACRIAAETDCEVVGAEPAGAMLAVARARPGGEKVTWVQSDGQSLRLDRCFELIIMTGHAFQALLSDAEAVALMTAAARHLGPGGRFAFETRNPARQAWRRWTPEATRELVATAAHGRVEAFYEAEMEGDGGANRGIVRIAQHCRFLDMDLERVGRSRIRFVARGHLESLIAQAGLAVAACYGDWDRIPCGPDSPEIIAIVGRPA